MARALHPTWCRERIVTVLKFLGDETGIDKKPTTRISAIAGLVGNEKSWEKFDRNWRKVLKAEDIPYFHAVACERAADEFYGLDVMKRGKIVDRLVTVIMESSLQPYSHGIVIPHFNAMSLDFRSHYTSGHPDIPYYLCLAQTFMEVSHTADKLPPEEQVLFLFEKQDEFEKDAGILFQEFKTNPDWPNHVRLADCHFVPIEDVPKYPGLQAADLLAYESFRQLDNKHFQPKLRPEWKARTAIKVLAQKLGEYGRYFDKKTLEALEVEHAEWLKEPKWEELDGSKGKR